MRLISGVLAAEGVPIKSAPSGPTEAMTLPVEVASRSRWGESSVTLTVDSAAVAASAQRQSEDNASRRIFSTVRYVQHGCGDLRDGRACCGWRRVLPEWPGRIRC